MENWKVKIVESPDTLLRKIFIYRKHVDGSITILHDNGVVESTPRGSAILKPTLEIMEDMLRPLLDALLEVGIKSKDQSFVEGKLESTGEHLKDLRKLLKLDVPNKTS